MTYDICDNFFSLILDESTNVSNVQCLGMTIRYYSPVDKCIVDTMYRLIHIASAKADDIYKDVLRCLQEDKLSLDRLVGIGTDGASAMIGSHHSLATLLQADVPHLTVFRCVCHSLHLAASKASESLPVVLEFLVREAHS